MVTIGTLRNGKYEVTRCDDLDTEGRPLYLITGKRGACYGLLRNYNHPEQLFATNINRPTGTTPFDASQPTTQVLIDCASALMQAARIMRAGGKHSD